MKTQSTAIRNLKNAQSFPHLTEQLQQLNGVSGTLPDLKKNYSVGVSLCIHWGG